MVWIQRGQRAIVRRGTLATSAFVATHFGAAAAVSWMGRYANDAQREKRVHRAISGLVAGLVAITPASGFVSPMAALVIGRAAGVICFWMVTSVKAVFGYDDSLDAFGVRRGRDRLALC